MHLSPQLSDRTHRGLTHTASLSLDLAPNSVRCLWKHQSQAISSKCVPSEMCLGNAKQHCRNDPEMVIYQFLSAPRIIFPLLFRAIADSSGALDKLAITASSKHQLDHYITSCQSTFFPHCSHRPFWKQPSSNSEWHCSLPLSEPSCKVTFFPEQLESISLNPSD